MDNRLKYALIGLSLLLGAAEIWRRLAMLVTPEIQLFGLVAFAGLFLLCTLGLVGVALLPHGWLRWPLALLLAAGSLLVDGYQWAVGDFMSYESFITMVQSAGDLGSAARQQGGAMLLAAARAGLLLAGLGLRPRGSGGWPGRIARIARIVALPVLLGLPLLLFFRGGEGASGLPSPQVGTSLALLYAYDMASTARGPRQPVTLTPAGPPPAADIVLVIDESIAGAYLDINSPTGVYSGLGADGKAAAGAGRAVPVHNFGLAAAINHCSVGSNIVLRFGGTRANYRDTIRSMPSLWAYARAAGLGTVYLDAQRTGGRYQNGMDDAERAGIDQWVQFADVPVVDRDHAVADRLAAYLADGQPQLILVNKVGGHFPVSDKFPLAEARYRPILARGRFADVTDMPGRDADDGRPDDWRRYRNSYRNTLLWNVGGFFDRLLASGSIGDATILYTSDHGQSFHERGDGGEATHCTPDPQIEEGVVPLVVIGDPARATRWAAAARAGHDRRSDYRIFPTLLGLMGYAARDVEPRYGPDLFSEQPDPFTFNSRFNARLGSEPDWRPIPLARIARPPLADYQQAAATGTK